MYQPPAGGNDFQWNHKFQHMLNIMGKMPLHHPPPPPKNRALSVTSPPVLRTVAYTLIRRIVKFETKTNMHRWEQSGTIVPH